MFIFWRKWLSWFVVHFHSYFWRFYQLPWVVCCWAMVDPIQLSSNQCHLVRSCIDNWFQKLLVFQHQWFLHLSVLVFPFGWKHQYLYQSFKHFDCSSPRPLYPLDDWWWVQMKPRLRREEGLLISLNNFYYFT